MLLRSITPRVSSLPPSRPPSLPPSCSLDCYGMTIRWENIITHVPCGDGVLPIEIEWVSRFKVNPPTLRTDCPQISASGLLSNSKGLAAWKKGENLYDSFLTHEMGHAVGIGCVLTLRYIRKRQSYPTAPLHANIPAM